MNRRNFARIRLKRWRDTLALGSMAFGVFISDAFAQVRPAPMGGGGEFPLGREWMAYFIVGFLVLIILVVLRSNSKRKQRDRVQAKKHRHQMGKMREERGQATAAAKPKHEQVFLAACPRGFGFGHGAQFIDRAFLVAGRDDHAGEHVMRAGTPDVQLFAE